MFASTPEPPYYAIAKWKADAEHRIAQQRGRGEWYGGYVTRIAKVERDYDFSAAHQR